MPSKFQLGLRKIYKRPNIHLIFYSLALASLMLLMKWLEFKVLILDFSMPFYVSIIAIMFSVLGGWMVYQWIPKTKWYTSNFDTSDQGAHNLSNREMEILQKLAEGKSKNEIARELFISPHTVKTHITNLYAKLDVNNKAQAIRKALDLRILLYHSEN